MLIEHVKHALTACARRLSMADDTPAMPLTDAHFGGFFVAFLKMCWEGES